MRREWLRIGVVVVAAAMGEGCGSRSSGSCGGVGAACSPAGCCARLTCSPQGFCATSACRAVGETCTSPAGSIAGDCCTALSCTGGRCVAPLTCRGLGGLCGPPGSPTEGRCCAPLACAAGRCATQAVCRAKGAACANGNDCCAGLVCAGRVCSGGQASTLTWTVTDDCIDGEDVQFSFVDAANNLVWPGNGQVYVAEQGQTYQSDLLCATGSTICVEGEQPMHGLTFARRCVTCSDAATSTIFTCP